jgi:hypothetical protein
MGTAQAIMNGGCSTELEALRKELDRHRLIRWVLNRFGETEYCQLIDMLTPSAKCSLGQIHRDEANKLLRSVVFKQPKILLLALRTLMFGRRPQTTSG